MIVLDTDLQLVGLQLKSPADLARLRDLTQPEEKTDVPSGKN